MKIYRLKSVDEILIGMIENKEDVPAEFGSTMSQSVVMRFAFSDLLTIVIFHL